MPSVDDTDVYYCLAAEFIVSFLIPDLGRKIEAADSFFPGDTID